jgi:hypothetical protein
MVYRVRAFAPTGSRMQRIADPVAVRLPDEPMIARADAGVLVPEKT